MSNINLFTLEEQQLVALYQPKENRLAVIRNIISDKNIMSEEVKEVSESTIKKLSAMSDHDYNNTGFTLTM